MLTSYLFPDTIFIYFNSPNDYGFNPMKADLIEAVGEEADTLEYNIRNFYSNGPTSYLMIQDCSGSMRPSRLDRREADIQHVCSLAEEACAT